MSLRSTLGTLGLSSSLDEGTPDEVIAKKRRAYAEKVGPARLEVARRNQKWTEIEDDLVPRGRGFLVSAATDHVYSVVRGVIFAPHSVSVVSDQAELFYFVARDGDLVFLERHPRTWSEIVERRERRKHGVVS